MQEAWIIELTENTPILETIEGFHWDQSFTPIPFYREKGKQTVYLFRGTFLTSTSKQVMTSLPCFYAMWTDTSIQPAGGIGPASMEDVQTPTIQGRITETSEKGEFELFLLSLQQKGEQTTFYEKWLAKMDGTNYLPKPVFGKLVDAFGDMYVLEKTETVLSIVQTITDQTRICSSN